MTKTHTRTLADRMLAAVEDRVNMNANRSEWGSTLSRKKKEVRLNESSEILGILRNVLKAWEAQQS